MTDQTKTDSAPVDIREEPTEQVLEEVVELLNATRNQRQTRDVGFMRWKYLDNPDGHAIVWTVRTHQTGKLVGFTACIPRRMMVNGKECLAWNGADFSIHPDYRTLGPAIKLRRQASLQIKQGRADFLYAHPNQKMAQVHARCGHAVLGRMIRVARPLQFQDRLNESRWLSWLKPIIGYAIDPVFRISLRLVNRRSAAVAELPTCTFDSRFDHLFSKHRGDTPTIGVRDARYLNWRWNPPSGDSYRVLIDQNADELRGFAIFSTPSDGLFVHDLFPVRDAATVQRLITGLVQLGAKERARSMSATALIGSRLLENLKKRYFYERPGGSDAYVFVPPEHSHLSSVSHAHDWFMTVGDRDV